MSIELLQGYTERIKRYEKDIQHNYIQIAMNLYEIQEFELIKDTEYKNIYDYALIEFGFEKSKTNELINIYKKFFFEERKAKKGILTYREYSITQLKYMLNMSEEQLKQCDHKLSVRAIKSIKLNSSTRVNNESIENTDNFKNELPGQNVITGIFPEKKEEEKQLTLIVSQLPKAELNSTPAPAATETETRTIITETITSQNNNFVPKSLNNDCPDETLQEQVFRLSKDNTDLRIQLLGNNQILEKQNDKLKSEIETYKEFFTYIHKELFESVKINNFNNVKDLVYELNEFTKYGKLPHKIKFMQEVI